MALLSKACSFTGQFMKLISSIEKYEILQLNFVRNHNTTRLMPGMRRKKTVEVEKVGIAPFELYKDEIGKDVFESRQADLPDFNMTNPFTRETRRCILCKHNITPDYKNVKLLSQFVSPHTGEIYGRHITGLCNSQQKLIEKEILKSRSAGFMPYYLKLVEFIKDPKLCDPLRPTRPHPY